MFVHDGRGERRLTGQERGGCLEERGYHGDPNTSEDMSGEGAKKKSRTGMSPRKKEWSVATKQTGVTLSGNTHPPGAETRLLDERTRWQV